MNTIDNYDGACGRWSAGGIGGGSKLWGKQCVGRVRRHYGAVTSIMEARVASLRWHEGALAPMTGGRGGCKLRC